MPEKLSFSWANYARPTPSNLEAIAASLRRILALVAGTTILAEASPWITFWIIVTGAVLDELKNFFAKVGHDYNEKVSINIPPDLQDKVEITENVKPEGE